MTEERKHNGFLTFLGDSEKVSAWVFRLLILCAMLYLQLNYVPKAEFVRYAEDRDRRDVTESRERIDKLNEIALTVARIDERLKRFESHP